ncbi:hypothetical protein GOP47_0019700 [Adiantum capillus-veneris]|uniref:BAH domain-containing protein n=1 Tax=Adiantum capillus-veneris TaxID=13818 RepID=A0A9D4Z8Q7_ADICA|nr:hypothetical protein GOP47_0019700 [Adiantum capillus-veneris]
MADNDAYAEFTWGKAKASSNKEKKFYTSFFYDNEEYSLHDNVIVHDKHQPGGHVAKIMRLWEDIATGTMMGLLRWYLRPLELPPHVQSQVACKNSKELFLAFGKGKGVSNENKLDCIERKCKVLCTSKHSRNKQPSEEDLKVADYFYNRMYNVDLKKLSNLEVIVKILGQDVLFNKPDWISDKQLGNQDTGSCPASTFPSATTHATPAASQPPVEDGEVNPDTDSVMRESRENQGQSIPLKRGSKLDSFSIKRANLASGDKTVGNRTRLQTSITKETINSSLGLSTASPGALERSPSTAQQPLTRSASAKKSEQSLLKAKIEANNGSEKTSSGRALFADSLPQSGFLIPTRARSKQVQHQDTILPRKPQNANLGDNLCHGRVLLIQNVDSSISLKDMNDLMKSALEGCCDVQMLQRSGSLSPPSGEVLLVFETEDLADAALQQFEENCLVISGSTRPLIARKVGVSDPGKIARFPGHFPLDNFKLWKQRQEEVMRKSFETFHFADPKTVEFEMASEWENLHEWLARCWEQLCKVAKFLSQASVLSEVL